MKALFTLIVMFFSIAPAHASEALLKKFFANVATMEAAFQQKIVDETGRSLERSSGRFYLSRPGKFRWSYRSIDPDVELGQQIIADGESIYMYDPDLEQVTRRSMQAALAQVPSLLLVQSDANLPEHFIVNDIGLTDGLSWVSLKPIDPDAGYQQLMLGFVGEQLNTILLLDGLGNETSLVLSEVVANLTLDSSVFDFTVPEGADLLSE
ncbi:MAG: outer membrane lipoprotein carrier protein [Arenicella sp.]|jgi:outer membrane lipoprotein carrier protein